MIYLKNTTEEQECYIPRQDEVYGQGDGSHCGSYSEGYSDGFDDGFGSGSTAEKNRLSAITITQNTSIVKNRGGYSAITVNVPQTGGTGNLENKTVVIDSDITTVTPSSGYDGMSAVTVDASEYAQSNYDNGFEDGFEDGYASGSSEERAKLSAVTFTANTAVTLSDGAYSAVTVNVAQTGHTAVLEEKNIVISADTTVVVPSVGYDGMFQVNIDASDYSDSQYESGYTSGYSSGYSSGFSSGYSSGETHQKSLLAQTAFTQNGVFLREDGWDEVNVNLNTAATWQEGYDSGFTDGSQGVTPDCDEAFNSGYVSGVTDGENNIISTFSSMTATSNGIYGSFAHPLSSITVNVDTASTYQSGYTSGHTDGVNEEKAKLSAITFTANTAVTVSNGGYSAITVNIDTATTWNDGYSSGYTDGQNDSWVGMIDRSISGNVTIPQSITEIGHYAFCMCGNITNVTFHSGVTKIWAEAFAGCAQLNNVTIPNQVTNLNYGAFSNCASLSNIDLNNVQIIGSLCFYQDSALSAITLPSSVSEIQTSAFSHCTNLRTIYCYSSIPPTVASSDVFYNVPSGGTLHYPHGSDYSSWENLLPNWTFRGDL